MLFDYFKVRYLLVIDIINVDDFIFIYDFMMVLVIIN